MPSLTTHHLYPPFPTDLPTAPLGSISLHTLQDASSSTSECAKLFEACRTLGFFYLDLTGSELGESILRESEELHELQQQFYAHPHEAKDEYGQDRVDPFFSYRWTQCTNGVRDAWGRPGRREMYSVSERPKLIQYFSAHLEVCHLVTRRRHLEDSAAFS